MNLYPCPTCDRGVTDRWKRSCNRCVAAFAAEWEPIERPTVLPMRPPALLRVPAVAGRDCGVTDRSRLVVVREDPEPPDEPWRTPIFIEPPIPQETE